MNTFCPRCLWEARRSAQIGKYRTSTTKPTLNEKGLYPAPPPPAAPKHTGGRGMVNAHCGTVARSQRRRGRPGRRACAIVGFLSPDGASARETPGADIGPLSARQVRTVPTRGQQSQPRIGVSVCGGGEARACDVHWGMKKTNAWGWECGGMCTRHSGRGGKQGLIFLHVAA